MKTLLIFVGLLILSALATDYSKTLQDQQIKEKIAIIDKAKTSSDPVVIQSAEVAKVELKNIADKKNSAVEKQKEADKPPSPQDTLFTNIMLVFGFMAIIPSVFRLMSGLIK